MPAESNVGWRVATPGLWRLRQNATSRRKTRPGRRPREARPRVSTNNRFQLTMIQILTTGGTIDKVYFDANSKFEIGESLLPELLRESNIHDGYIIRELIDRKSV